MPGYAFPFYNSKQSHDFEFHLSDTDFHDKREF